MKKKILAEIDRRIKRHRKLEIEYGNTIMFSHESNQEKQKVKALRSIRKFITKTK